MKQGQYNRAFIKQLCEVFETGLKQGLVVGVEISSRVIRWLVDDGTASIPCLLWENNAGERYIGLERGKKVLVRGRLDLVHGEAKILIDRILPFQSILQECFWINQTLFLLSSVRVRSFAMIDTKLLWDQASSRLGKSFSAKEITSIFAIEEVSGVLEKWSAEGLIYQMVADEKYHRIPCSKIESMLVKLLKNSQGPLHLRFLHNCLQTDGVKISTNGVRRCMNTINLKHDLRQDPMDVYSI